MGLKGTLADIAIIDLIQFPHSGRRTGHLVVSGTDGDATLFYEDGSLVHATVGDAFGIDALVRVVAWEEGTFEFVPNVATEARSIDLDLHRAVMQALKLHDEMKMEEEQMDQDSDKQRAGDEVLAAKLSEFLTANDFAMHASVLAPEGGLRAAVDGDGGTPDEIGELRSTLHALLGSHPRGVLTRILIEDDFGTVVLVRLKDGSSLLAVASEDASLGAVSMSTGRLAAALS